MGQGESRVTFSGYGVSVWEDDEKVLATDGGDGCTIM